MRGGRGRRRLRWWHVYLVLLVLSNIVQVTLWVWPSEPSDDALRTIEVPHMTETGSGGGEPVTLGFHEYGDPTSRTKVLAIHGCPTMGNDFAFLGPMLAADAHVVAVQMPGFGASDKWVGSYGVRAQARYALAVMDGLGWKHTPAHVVGYSLGGGTALEIVDIAPDRVASVTLLAGIGIQEGEGSGDYHFEHLKYNVGYGLFMVGAEAVPHFGLLGKRSFRHGTLRSFMDTDQRPLRVILEKMNEQKTPLLIVHGDRDPLVPADTARSHHNLVEHSELVMIDYGESPMAHHGMLFSKEGSHRTAEVINDFIARVKSLETRFEPTRRTVDLQAGEVVEHESPLPFGWDLKRGMSPWHQIVVIVVGTYVLEDPTTVFTGLMIEAGQVDIFVGVFAVFIGIFTGDLGLYLIGAVVGRRALAWKPLAKRLPVRHVERLGGWFDRHGFKAVLASRFIPGSRFPLYISAGSLGIKPIRFALWTAVAVAIWAVVMTSIVVGLSDEIMQPIKRLTGGRVWLAWVVAIVVLVMVMRTIAEMLTSIGRARLKAFVSRFWQHEFWSAWVFYAPLVPWVAMLMARYGRFETMTAVNPAMPHSGFVGESKYDILSALPEDSIIPTVLIEPGTLDGRLAQLQSEMTQRGWSWPLVLKPNEGQRGFAVQKIAGVDDAVDYFRQVPIPIIAQIYHPGPYEAGIFYYRMPGEETGHIYSITDKQRQTLVGDGKHSLEQLIYRDRRLRMQADLFLQRFGDDRDRVLDAGEELVMSVAMNHAQGAIFRDGAHLITPALERRVDAIARHYEGFYFGRFDVRYTDADRLRAGEDFHIVELNGVMSESTNLYDPKRSVFWAYGVLFRQWAIAFRIGRENRRRGAEITPLFKLFGAIRAHYKRRDFRVVSD